MNKNKNKNKRSLFSSLLLCSAFALSSLLGPNAHAKELIIGVIGDNVSKTTSNYRPLGQYLSARLEDEGITGVRTLVVPSSDNMAMALSKGDVDIFLDSPLVAAKIARNSGAKPFLRRWKKGVADYHSVILVPTNSALQSVEDLVGSRIAFQERDSSSGFMMPADIILATGATMLEQTDPQDPVDPDQVNYYFSGSDRHTLTWLAKGWVEAAGTDYPTFEKLQKARPNEYRIIAKSRSVPRQVVLQSRQMTPQHGEAIKRVLVNMNKDPEGQAILAKLKKTTKFDSFPDGAEKTFEPIFAMLDRLTRHGLF